jgi:hypothetical protein
LVYNFEVADLLIQLLILWGWASSLPFSGFGLLIGGFRLGWNLEEQGQLPPAQGNLKYVVVAVEYFSKWIDAKPLGT